MLLAESDRLSIAAVVTTLEREAEQVENPALALLMGKLAASMHDLTRPESA